MYLTIINYSTTTPYLKFSKEKIKKILEEKKQEQIKRQGIIFDYAIFFSFGKYDLSLIFLSTNYKIINYLENTNLLYRFDNFQFKSGFSNASRKYESKKIYHVPIGLLNQAQIKKFPYVGICSITIKKQFYLLGRKSFQALIFTFQKKLTEKKGIKCYLFYSFGYEDFLLLIFSDSIYEIKNKVIELRELQILDIYKDSYKESFNYNIECQKWEINPKNKSSSNEIENFHSNILKNVNFFHIILGTNTIICINYDDHHQDLMTKKEANVKINTEYMIIPGHLSTCSAFFQKYYNIDILDGHFAIVGNYDIQTPIIDTDEFFKHFSKIYNSNDLSMTIPIYKQKSNLLFTLDKSHIKQSMEKIRSRKPIDDLNNEKDLCLPNHIKQYINNILHILKIVSENKNTLYIFRWLQLYYQELITAITRKSGFDENEVGLWLKKISNLITERYLGAQSLLEAGEIHNILYKGSYIKFLFIVDSLLNRFFIELKESLSSLFSNRKDKIFLFTILGDVYVPELSSCIDYFNSAFIIIPFYYQSEPESLSILLHECAHIIFRLNDNRIFGEITAKAIERCIINDNREYCILEQLIETENNAFEGKFKGNFFVWLSEDQFKEYLININNLAFFHKQVKEELNYQCFSFTDIVLHKADYLKEKVKYIKKVYEEAFCDFTVLVFFSGTKYFIDFYKVLIDIIIYTKIQDHSIFDRICIVFIWYYCKTNNINQFEKYNYELGKIIFLELNDILCKLITKDKEEQLNKIFVDDEKDNMLEIIIPRALSNIQFFLRNFLYQKNNPLRVLNEMVNTCYEYFNKPLNNNLLKNFKNFVFDDSLDNIYQIKVNDLWWATIQDQNNNFI